VPLVFPLAKLIVPLVKDHIRLARGEIVGYAGRIACCMPCIDDVAVFAIFIVVRPPLQQSSPLLNG
jgi:hypothetical protein